MRERILHPFVIPLFPVLFLYARNQGQLQPRQLLIPLALALAASLMLFLSLRRMGWAPRTAAVGVSVTGLWFFGYSPFYDIVADLCLLATGRDLPRWSVLVLYLLFLAGLLAGIARGRDLSRALHPALNAMGVALLCMALWPIARFEFSEWRAWEATPAGGAESLSAPPRGALPDIYYIILDGYGGEEMLCDLYGFDNSAMTGFLRSRGFYVVEGARSNYMQTPLSLASALNHDYIESLLLRDHSGDQSREPLRGLIQHSAMFRKLSSLGYTIVVFKSRYPLVDVRGPGLYLKVGGGMDEFTLTLLAQTPLSFFGAAADGLEDHRRAVLGAFDRLERIPAGRHPFMVLAHIVSPHPPFVFDRHGRNPMPGRNFSVADGSLLNMDPQRYRRLYLEQLQFINGRVRLLVDRLLSGRGREAVIILQGDHGPGSEWDRERIEITNMEERFSILNAIYFPDGDYRLLHPGITPVNTFRVVSRQYLGQPLDLLGDRSYYATMTRPFQFVRVY